MLMENAVAWLFGIVKYSQIKNLFFDFHTLATV